MFGGRKGEGKFTGVERSKGGEGDEGGERLMSKGTMEGET